MDQPIELPDASQRLLVVPFGALATAVAGRAIDGAKGDDPLAPVTVVVPSAHAGVTVRRQLAREGGLINVSFLSFPQLAAVLAAPLVSTDPRFPLTRTLHCAVIRSVLDDQGPAWLRAGSSTSVTAMCLADTFEEISDLPAQALEELASLGSRSDDVVDLYRTVRDRCRDLLSRRDVLVAAIEAVRVAAPSLPAAGHVVLFAPRKLGHLEADLSESLASRAGLTAVLGSTRSPHDPDLARIIERLEPVLGAPVFVNPAGPSNGSTVAGEAGAGEAAGPGEAGPGEAGPGEAGPGEAGPGAAGPGAAVAGGGGSESPGASRVSVVRAPDPDEEVRAVVRRVLEEASRGTPLDRMAVVARVVDPYLALAHEQLGAAGVAHHGPSGLRLSQSIAGRALLGGLGLVADDLPRAGLLRWLRSVPLQQPDRRPLPVDSFDRIARQAGIAGGRGQWSARLGVASAEVARQLELAAGSPATEARLRRRADHLLTITELVGWLGGMADELAALSRWDDHADWARRFICELLGPPDQPMTGMPEVASADISTIDSPTSDGATIDGPMIEAEHRARQLVLAVLGRLGHLDGLAGSCDRQSFFDAVRAGLDDEPIPSGTAGHGVFVGALSEAVGASHDLVLVMGMAEGTYPPAVRDDPILPDRLRAALGEGAMAPRRTPRAQQHRDHLAVLASAPTVVLSFARTDPRSEREQLPSRWLLEQVQELLPSRAEPIAPDDLDKVPRESSWFLDLPSFAATVERTARLDLADPELPLVSAAELTAVTMFANRTLRPSESGVSEVVEVAVPSDRPDLSAGLDATRQRQAGQFGPYTGHVGAAPQLLFDEARVGSATSFEAWATCPLRYFLGHVLDIRKLDERAETDDIKPLDRGSFMHSVLEELVSESIRAGEIEAESPSTSQIERLRQVAARVGERFRTQGRTGRPLLWSLRSEQLLRRLEQVLAADLAHRADRAVQPVAVELAFGTTGASSQEAVPPVVVRLKDGRPLGFRGFIDRVDRSTDGDRLVVIDYKTGKDDGYAELKGIRGAPVDIVCRGRHLQLGLYALAAQSRFGDLPVTAFFWFIEKSSRKSFLGGEIDQAALDRLREALGVIVDGIEAGVFPARPGDEGHYGFANCGFCDFDSICPSTRGHLWQSVRLAEPLERYRDLAEAPLEANRTAMPTDTPTTAASEPAPVPASSPSRRSSGAGPGPGRRR